MSLSEREIIKTVVLTWLHTSYNNSFIRKGMLDENTTPHQKYTMPMMEHGGGSILD